jgi:hypothetical protein
MSNSSASRTARLGKYTINNLCTSSLSRIIGPKGDQGIQGDAGADGTNGDKGDKGAKGDAGATIVGNSNFYVNYFNLLPSTGSFELYFPTSPVVSAGRCLIGDISNNIPLEIPANTLNIGSIINIELRGDIDAYDNSGQCHINFAFDTTTTINIINTIHIPGDIGIRPFYCNLKVQILSSTKYIVYFNWVNYFDPYTSSQSGQVEYYRMETVDISGVNFVNPITLNLKAEILKTTAGPTQNGVDIKINFATVDILTPSNT